MTSQVESMGKFLRKFKNIGQTFDKQANTYARAREEKPKEFRGGRIHDKRPEKIAEGVYDDFGEESLEGDEGIEPDYGRYDEVGIQTAQKPESFHHFILENQYKDLEMSIRGYKSIFDKTTREWRTVRKGEHCFTDEESEEILRTAQSHLATDIKLSFINKEVFGEMMMAIYKRLDELFYSIGEYRYGRYNFDKDGNPIKNGSDKQYKMKLQNRKIFLELWTRIQANYSRAIQGQENRYTHESVKGQESLQGGRDDFLDNRRYS
jgi:hypothetical protein